MPPIVVNDLGPLQSLSLSAFVPLKQYLRICFLAALKKDSDGLLSDK